MAIPRLVNEVIEGLKSRSEVDAILLGGSRAGDGLFDADSDWDLYVYLSSSLDVEMRRSLLSPRSTVLELDNHYWEPEDDGELNDGTSFELIYRTWDLTESLLSRIVERSEASVGYTTCFWHNLVTGQIIFDRTGRAVQVRKRFEVPFPQTLKSAIVAKNWPLLNIALPNFKDQVVLALKRQDFIAVQHRIAAFLASAFDLVFAANGRLHPGEKRLVQHSMNLPVLPSNWLELLKAVDTANQGARVGLPAALERLAAAIESFLVRLDLLASPAKPRSSKESVTPRTPEASVSSPQALTVYTDGGCIGNPGKGAWAYLIDDGQLRDEGTGGDPLTTNNKMELQAVIEALCAIDSRAEWRGRPIRIHTDSQYVRNGITSWIKTWSANGWKTSAKEPVNSHICSMVRRTKASHLSLLGFPACPLTHFHSGFKAASHRWSSTQSS